MKTFKRIVALGLCVGVVAGTSFIPTRVSATEGDVVFTFHVGDNDAQHIALIARDGTGEITPGTQGRVGSDFAVTVDGGDQSIITPERTSNSTPYGSSDVAVTCSSSTDCRVVISNLNGDGVRFSTPGGAGFAFRYANGDAYMSTATNLTANADFDVFVPEEGGPSFTGQAYVAWKCATHDGVCFALLTIPPAANQVDHSTRDFTYFAASTVVDARTSETFSNFDNEDERGFVLTGAMDEWVAAYKTRNSVSEVNWANVEIADFLYGVQDEYRGAKIPPLGEPMGNNSYVSYGEHAFNAIIYGDEYASMTAVNVDALSYVPYGFAANPVELSGTTASSPASLEMPLLDDTITLDSTGVRGFAISNVEVLDSNISTAAVSVAKDPSGAFKITFGSNFFDNVEFKITGENGQVYYVKVKRVTFTQMDFEHATIWNNNFNGVRAELIFDEATSYNDYEVTANVVYKDGSSKRFVAENLGWVDENYGGNLVFANEYSGSMSGKGLKRANYGVRFDGNDYDRDIASVYFNVKYTGSTSDVYAGTFAGSGRGILMENRR